MVFDQFQTSELVKEVAVFSRSFGKFVIYIVDDDDSIRRALKRLFKSIGMKAQTFASAAEFLEYADLDSKSCLVLDVKMPVIDGFELQEILKNNNIIIPIIFISAYDDNEIRERALKGGAKAFLSKPVNDRILMAEVLDTFGIEKKDNF